MSAGINTAPCDALRIKLNSAQDALNLATQARDQVSVEHRKCLSPQEQGSANLQDADPQFKKAMKEAEELQYMNEFLLRQLQREAKSAATVNGLASIAEEEAAKVQGEIDDLRAQIRTEKRRFLDAGPSVSPAVAGLYFTQVPDNQMLIALLTSVGALLTFVSVLVLMGLMPLFYFERLTGGERWKFVGGLWVSSLILIYVGLAAFT
jgi:hypothetical protein